MQTWSSPVGAKFQITLPKKVREALGIRQAGDLIGFWLDGSKVVLAKAEVTPQGQTFTEEEWDTLMGLSKTPVRKTYSAKAFTSRHRRLTRR